MPANCQEQSQGTAREYGGRQECAHLAHGQDRQALHARLDGTSSPETGTDVLGIESGNELALTNMEGLGNKSRGLDKSSETAHTEAMEKA